MKPSAEHFFKLNIPQYLKLVNQKLMWITGNCSPNLNLKTMKC